MANRFTVEAYCVVTKLWINDGLCTLDREAAVRWMVSRDNDPRREPCARRVVNDAGTVVEHGRFCRPDRRRALRRSSPCGTGRAEILRCGMPLTVSYEARLSGWPHQCLASDVACRGRCRFCRWPAQ
jgi:hypothetical protein